MIHDYQARFTLFEHLQPYLGSKGGQHSLAASRSSRSSSSSQQGGKKSFSWTMCLKTGMQVAQNNRREYAQMVKQVLCDFEPSSPFDGRCCGQKQPFLCFEAVFRAIVLKS